MNNYLLNYQGLTQAISEGVIRQRDRDRAAVQPATNEPSAPLPLARVREPTRRKRGIDGRIIDDEDGYAAVHLQLDCPGRLEMLMLRKLMIAAAAFAAMAVACAPARAAGVRQRSVLANHAYDSSRYVLMGRSHPGDWVSLNPQPLPPGERALSGSYVSRPGSWVMLNPQPLPPRVYRYCSTAQLGGPRIQRGPFFSLHDDQSLAPGNFAIF